MRSRTGVPPVLLGRDEPRISSIPLYVSSAGQEAIELAEMAGLDLDPWQRFTLGHSLGERKDGKWAASEVGVCVARQNGKGGLLEGRELAGLFLGIEKDITHSAHQFDTSLEAMGRLLELIESTPEFDQRVQRVSNAHGKEGITLKGGARIRFRTRTKGGGRGFSGELLVLDEAMILPEVAMGALVPTLSARPNTQIWYLGSAVDELVHEHGTVFARVRARGLAGQDPRLLYVEWSPPGATHPDKVTAEMARDPEMWAEANPGLGIRITTDAIETELRSLAHRTFVVERLSIGAWPDLEQADGDGITKAGWAKCEDRDSELLDPIYLAVDTNPDRTHTAIAAAGKNEDGDWHVELVDYRPGTAWAPKRVKKLLAKHKVTGKPHIIARSQAATIAKKLTDDLGIEVELVDQEWYGEAVGETLDAVRETLVRHVGETDLETAAVGAKQVARGDVVIWSRKTSSVDISPLVAVSVALYAAMSGGGRSVYEDRDLIVL